nr:hypothetical protein [Tanacetum cinerariifolium]
GNATTRGGSFNYRGGVFGPYGGCEGIYLAKGTLERVSHRVLVGYYYLSHRVLVGNYYLQQS